MPVYVSALMFKLMEVQMTTHIARDQIDTHPAVAAMMSVVVGKLLGSILAIARVQPIFDYQAPDISFGIDALIPAYRNPLQSSQLMQSSVNGGWSKHSVSLIPTNCLLTSRALYSKSFTRASRWIMISSQCFHRSNPTKR
jgi:hypothetical protein